MQHKNKLSRVCIAQPKAWSLLSLEQLGVVLNFGLSSRSVFYILHKLFEILYVHFIACLFFYIEIKAPSFSWYQFYGRANILVSLQRQMAALCEAPSSLQQKMINLCVQPTEVTLQHFFSVLLHIISLKYLFICSIVDNP